MPLFSFIIATSVEFKKSGLVNLAELNLLTSIKEQCQNIHCWYAEVQFSLRMHTKRSETFL